MAMYVCNLCSGDPFRSPDDEHGVALMQAHLNQEHGGDRAPDNQDGDDDA